MSEILVNNSKFLDESKFQHAREGRISDAVFSFLRGRKWASIVGSAGLQ